MKPKSLNSKMCFISVFFSTALLLIPLFFAEAIETTEDRQTMKASAHDLSNEASTVSCLNCHWMHQKGDSQDGFAHSLISNQTIDVCFICHGGLNPNLETAALLERGYFSSTFYQSKPSQMQGADTVFFPGQIGKNPYDIMKEYALATVSDSGSYHMFYGDKYSGVPVTEKGSFNCFSCHNHGVYESTLDSVGGRLPKLLWSKGSYSNFGTTITKADRKDTTKFYASEYYCLSCHVKYGYPDRWKGSTYVWNSTRIQINDTFFLATKHHYLERYGTSELLGVPELRNPYGFGNDISCFVCHSRHASAYPSLIRYDSDNLPEEAMCLRCHHGETPARPATFSFSYVHETTFEVNYITAGHFADKKYYTTDGHGKAKTSGGAGLACTFCHNPHGTGLFKMVKSVVRDPRFAGGDTTYDSSYTLSAQDTLELQSLHAVSGFCGGACHRNKSPVNYDTWMQVNMVSFVTAATMPSYYQGADLYDSSKHKGIYNSVQAEVMGTSYQFSFSNCSACHDAHGTQFPVLLWGSDEKLCFQCHNDSTVGGAPNIKKYFDSSKSRNVNTSRHPVYDTFDVYESGGKNDQSATVAVECINCHNPHLATKQNPTIYPYNWAMISDSSAFLNTNGAKDHENRAKFCASCHSTTFPQLDPRIYPYGTSYTTTIAYPPGVKISSKKIGDEWFALVNPSQVPGTLRYVTNGHYKNGANGLIDCINCHSPHGSSNPSNIRDEAFIDPIDSGVDNFIGSVYTNFGNYAAFYNENTKISRKFCYTADTAVTYGCHTPQYLTTQVTFPDNLEQDSARHRTRRVPYGPRGASYYIDEHDPLWDTTLDSTVTPPSKIWGCSVCHYQAHNPTPNYWYENSAKGIAQNCLECHHPEDSTTSYYNSTTAKFFGGAPTKYENPYVEFASVSVFPLSTTYISKHLKTADSSTALTATISGYCKQCHGEHYDKGPDVTPRKDEYHDVPRSFVKSPDTTLGYVTAYLDSTSFCLACHRGTATLKFASKRPPDINITYNTAGHGRLGRGDTSTSDKTNGIQVFCFDCHTKHASQNPKLLRTKIRDLITYSSSGIWDTLVSNRQIRVEDMDTGFSSVSVITYGYQAVCFACHSLPGSVYDSSRSYQNNAYNSNPGTKLWLGKDTYNSAGHGFTLITPYAYVDTAIYGTTKAVSGGMKCSWCHEPHGRGTDSNGVFNSTYNDDMLEIGSTTETGGNTTLCYKCHNKVLTAPDSSYSIANIKELFESSFSAHNIDDSSKIYNDIQITCLNCHNPHTGSKENPVVVADYRTDANPGDDAFCISCHLADTLVPNFELRGNPPPSVEFPTKDPAGAPLSGFDKSLYTTSAHGERGAWCRTCHKPHGTMKYYLLREVYDFNQSGVVGGHSYDSIYTTTRYGTTDFREEDVCFGCHRNHELETTGAEKWNTAWADIPDILQFYQIFDTVTKTYGARTRSHHNVFLDEQRGPDSTWGSTGGYIDDTRVECESCHNQHLASKSKPLTNPDAQKITMSAWGDDCISFCLKCHDNDPPPGIYGLTDEKYKNILKEYGEPDKITGKYKYFGGHYRQLDGKPLECRYCHSMHGSNYSKQIQDGLGAEYDTFKMMRNMRSVTLTDSSLGGNDTLALSSVTEICLSCHSGKTQFYDRDAFVWRDIPLAPPPQYLNDAAVNTAVYHPMLYSTLSDSFYLAYADSGLVVKKVKSVYSSTDFNVVDTTVDAAGCNCHGAHNPYKSASNEFSNCFNCHNGIAGIPDQETPFDTGKFRSGPAPLIEDDNTLLLLHLDGNYEGDSKEEAFQDMGLEFSAGKYGLAVSFETIFITTKLAYPLWSNKTTGAVGQVGRVQHNRDNDLTLRFNGTCNDEDAGGPRYINALSTSTGVSYGEGYVPGITGAVYLGTGSSLTCSTHAAGVTPQSNKEVIDISSSTTRGSVQAWVKFGDPGTGIQDTTEDRYLFLHSTTSGIPYKNAIFLRHSKFNTWDVGVSDEAGYQYNVVSAKDELRAGWHHIAATWSLANKQLKIYIDGVLVASEGAVFFPVYTATTFRIGSASVAGGAINTYIDEFQVSNDLKSEEEILADYNGQNGMNFNMKRGTLAFWVKPNWNGNDNNDHTFFDNSSDTTINYFRLQKTSSNDLKFTIKGRGATTAISYAVNDSTLPANAWSHIAAGWEDFDSSLSIMKLFLNGMEVYSTAKATMMGYADTAIYIGSLKTGAQSVNAALDEVWITDIMQDTSVIAAVHNGLSNTNSGSTTSPTESFLPDPTSLGLLLHYDTSYNGANGEAASYNSVSFAVGKFDSALSISGNGSISYLSGNGYSQLALANNFNNSLGTGVLDSTGPIIFTQGFLGGATGGVLVDSSDVLSFNNNIYRVYYYYNDGSGNMQLAYKETLNSTPPDSANLSSRTLLKIGSGSADQAQSPDILRLADGRYRLYYGYFASYYNLAYKETLNTNLPDSTNLGQRMLLGTGSSSSDRANGPNVIQLDSGKYRVYYYYNNGTYPQLAYKETNDTNPPVLTNIGYRQLLGIGSSASDQASMPNIIRLPDNTYRIYYGYQDSGAFWKLAYRQTSNTNAPDSTNIGAQQLLNTGSSTSDQALGPNVIRLSNGKYRIYYQYYNGSYYQLAYKETSDTTAPASANLGSRVTIATGSGTSDQAYDPNVVPMNKINAKNGTIQVWVNINSGIKNTGSKRYIIRSTDTTFTENNSFALFHDTDSTWKFTSRNSTTTSTVSIADNLAYGWHNFAATWDTSALKLYIDGELQNTAANPYLPDSTANRYYVGCGGTSGQINTALDELLIDGAAKTQSQIIANIQASSYNYSPVTGTIEMWMKPIGWTGTDTSKQRYLFDAHNNSLTKDRVSLYYDTTNEIKFDVYSSTGILRSVKFDVSAIIDTTAFRHYAGTWDQYNVNLYINGILASDTTYTAVSDQRPVDLFIGSNGRITGQADAIIDEVRIYDVLRNAEAIKADADGAFGYKMYFSNSFDPYSGGSRHPVNMDSLGYDTDIVPVISKMECLKCHLQLDSTAIYHRRSGGLIRFVDVDSSMVWNQRVSKYDNSTKANVTKFCLSCHMRPDINFDTITDLAASGYTFSGVDPTYGGKPVQLRPLLDSSYGDSADTPQPKPGGGYYYPIDTASAHFDSSFGPSAVGGLSCTDCHDPHGSINKSMLQDFEEAKEQKDYNRDGVMSREIQYLDKENVRLYQLNEEKFCFFCHNGQFNTTGVNPPGSIPGDPLYWKMKDIEGKFAYKGAHHMVDDAEQDEYDVRIECTNCHNPHTVRRDAVVLNPQTGQRGYVTATVQMNRFCVGCHGDSVMTNVIPTTWDDGVKFPGALINKPVPEWTGNSWNKFNKQTMVSGNKHFQNVECAACHDPHGTSNYRMLSETVLNKYTALGGNPSSPSTTFVYGLQLMLQTKPDNRRRYEVYSTVYGSTATNYSINRFCFGCHKNSYGFDPDYARGYIYPGETTYNQWDFGTTGTSSIALIRYDSVTAPGYANRYLAPDVLGKDKDCDYCHNPHGSDSTRIRMVRDNVPQDLDRNSPNFGDRVDSVNWFQEGFPATGVDFCLSKGCHVTNRFSKLGPRDPEYDTGGANKWWSKSYDQFNLIDYGEFGALTYSTVRNGSFRADGIAYTTVRASKHPIVPYDKFLNTGNTLICLSCHTPHGSPGNTELAASYGSYYESTYPQDAAGLRRAYFRRVYWWPVTFWKRASPNDPAVGHAYGRATYHYNFVDFRNYRNDYDVYGLMQNDAYYSPFVNRKISTYVNLYGNAESNDAGEFPSGDGGNPLHYAEKVFQQNIPSAGNDLCYMCHPMSEIAGQTGWDTATKSGPYIGIDTTKTRFVGHEAVIGGSKIGETKFGSGSAVGNMGLNLKFAIGRSDFHKFTCSMCHGPHASTNEKLITNKCFAFNRLKPPAPSDMHWADYDNRGRPSVYCHPYDNNESPNWNAAPTGHDTESGTTFVGWRNMVDTTKMDFDRPAVSIDTLFVYFNTAGVYDTNAAIPGLSNFYVTCSDFDVVLTWRSVYDNSKWIDHYNVYRGETTLTQANKAYKTNPLGTTIKTWPAWGYSFVSRVYDTNLTRPYGDYNTLYTIDPSFAHTLGKRYYYIIAPADSDNNEALTPNCQDTAGAYYSSTNTVAPRPVTVLSVTQETYDTGGFIFKMRFMWQDPGDNLATKAYALYANLIDTSQFNTTYSSLSAYLANTTYIGTLYDTSFNTDIISAINFGDYYVTTSVNTDAYNSAAVIARKIFLLGIKPSDYQNNTASVFSLKYIRIADPAPSLINDLTARPNPTVNLTDTTNDRYNVTLSWSVPWDNAQLIESTSIPIYKVYRRLNNPINQIDLNRFNLSDTALSDVENIAVLTAYNSVALSQYGYGSTITYIDNVEPNKVYYYAVTSIDKYATAAANLADTVYGYATDRAGRLYREQILPGYNTKLLSPISSKLKPAKTNTRFSFSFNEALYETASFKEYRFYERYATDRAWRFNSSYIETSIIHGGTVCWNCHTDRLTHGDTSECRICHPGNGRGGLDVDTTYPVGTYYFAGSIVYNSVKVIIDGRTTTVANLESPLNEIASLTVYDLIPPSPFVSINYNLVPAKENGYDSIRLSWSGGIDTANFKNFVIRYSAQMVPLNVDLSGAWVTQDYSITNTYTSTWTAVPPQPSAKWQSDWSYFGDFSYKYEVQAWDSDYNYSSTTIMISTNPPSGILGPKLNLTGVASNEIRLSWNNMYNYSYTKDYSAAIGGYKIYAKETTGTIDHILYGTTLNVDTAYGINLIKTVSAVLDSTVWPTGNQAQGVSVVTSSNALYAENANDGSEASLWYADAFDTFLDTTTYITFDLGSRKEIATITYNNSFAGISFGADSTDTSQGYTIRVADTGMIWETVTTQLKTAARGETEWPRTGAITPIRYIQVTGFSSYATSGVAASVVELKAKYPSDTTTTIFYHNDDNPLFKAKPSHYYAYGIYLQDTTGALSRSAYSPTAYLVRDYETPLSVIDLVAFGSSVNKNIGLRWTKPYDNVGVNRYEIWRREGNPDIVDNNGYDFSKNVRLSSTYSTVFYIDSATVEGNANPYWYAVCAVDSSGNRSKFTGKDYSVSAYSKKEKDTIPPTSILLLENRSYYTKKKDGGPRITLAWALGQDQKNYDSLGNVDNNYYANSTVGVNLYSIYKVDYALDSTPFGNELALLTPKRSDFDSGYATTIGIVASGWKAGTWGSTDVLMSIDSTQPTPAQKMLIYNYSTDPNTQITSNPKYVRSGAYLKSTGYALETSQSVDVGMETATTHYIFGVWLKVAGAFPSPTYTGKVFVDIATKLNTGNESTYTLIARRTIDRPSYDWKYYVLTFVTPTSGLDTTSENGIMIWGNNDGTIWMDSAKLIYLGKPVVRPPDTTSSDTNIGMNKSYFYAVTAVDCSKDANMDDGFSGNLKDGNEGDFANMLNIETDEREPYFESAYTAMWDSTPWLPVQSPLRILKTGTTPTIYFMPGMTPTDKIYEQYGDNGLIFDSDNIFKNGDYVTFKMKIMDPNTGMPDTTILKKPGLGFIDADYSSLDVTRWGILPAVTLGGGEYKFYFRISSTPYLYYTAGVSQRADTYYNSVTGMYESLSRLIFYAVDKSGNGPFFDDTTGLDTTDNNPDRTYLGILDNIRTDAPGYDSGAGEGEEP